MRLPVASGATTLSSVQWAKVPTAWIRYDNGLLAFKAASPGVDAAALKLYILLCLLMHPASRKQSTVTPVVRVTYDQLERKTNLSRSLVSRGLRRLVELGRISIDQAGRANQYSVVGYEDGTRGWGKLPETHLLAADYGTRLRIASVGHRARADRDALKLYLALVAFRDGASGSSRLSYDKMQEYTGVPRQSIRRALNVLFEAALISRERLSESEAVSTTAHQYWVSGLPSRRASDQGIVPLTARNIGSTGFKPSQGAA